jgi:hypothetical protein
MKKQLDKMGEAADYFQLAAEMNQNDSPMNAIISLEQAVECLVKLSIFFLDIEPII